MLGIDDEDALDIGALAVHFGAANEEILRLMDALAAAAEDLLEVRRSQRNLMRFLWELEETSIEFERERSSHALQLQTTLEEVAEIEARIGGLQESFERTDARAQALQRQIGEAEERERALTSEVELRLGQLAGERDHLVDQAAAMQRASEEQLHALNDARARVVEMEAELERLERSCAEGDRRRAELEATIAEARRSAQEHADAAARTRDDLVVTLDGLRRQADERIHGALDELGTEAANEREAALRAQAEELAAERAFEGSRREDELERERARLQELQARADGEQAQLRVAHPLALAVENRRVDRDVVERDVGGKVEGALALALRVLDGKAPL